MAKEDNIFRGKNPEVICSCFGYIPKCKEASQNLAWMDNCQVLESLVYALFPE